MPDLTCPALPPGTVYVPASLALFLVSSSLSEPSTEPLAALVRAAAGGVQQEGIVRDVYMWQPGGQGGGAARPLVAVRGLESRPLARTQMAACPDFTTPSSLQVRPTKDSNDLMMHVSFIEQLCSAVWWG